MAIFLMFDSSTLNVSMALQWEDELVTTVSVSAMAIFPIALNLKLSYFYSLFTRILLEFFFRAMWIVPIRIGGLVAPLSCVVTPWEIKK